MPKDPAHNTFLYHAHGHALSGRITRPVEHLIEVQAGTSLPTIGGHGSSSVSNFRFQDFVTFSNAYTNVSGSRNERDGSFTTLVTSTVDNLNILDVVTADRVVARMSSERGPDDDESHVLILGSKFQNLRIAGCLVDVDLNHELFQRMDTFQSFKKEFKSNSEFRKMAEDPFQTGKSQKLPDPDGVFICSLVKDAKTTCPGAKRTGHGIDVPQFGKVFVAEVHLEHHKRTLTMLRLELGSPVGGQIVVAQIQGNGQPWH
jgi:hypothetical protein